MAEPEGLLIDGARIATVAARDLWRRVSPATESPGVPLSRVRERLEFFAGALLGQALPILPADPAPAPTWLARVMGRAPRHLRPRTAVPTTDGRRIWLPRVLHLGGSDATLAAYRLLAVEQATRALRGTPHRLPAAGSGPRERDLYLLSEAVAVDAQIARQFPGLVADLIAARTAELDARPALERLTPAERAVEMLLRGVLAAPPAHLASEVALAAAPKDSAAWAAAMNARFGRDGRYRGVAPVGLWGACTTATGPVAGAYDAAMDVDADPRTRIRTAPLRHRPRIRQARADEDDARPGTWMVKLDDPMESVEDPMGLNRPSDRDDAADPRALGDSLSELPEARIVRTPGRPREVLESDVGPATSALAAAGDVTPGSGIVYPEWDYRLNAYGHGGAVVWPGIAAPGTAKWVDAVMQRHAALVRQVRQRFAVLRSRRVRLTRQIDGPELDLAAQVVAFADRRAGQSGDDRLYMDLRPARRDLAIAMLVDVSASTDSWVGGSLRVIDVEKDALVVLLEALDALGDRHAVLAFSGEGPARVRVLTVKAFHEAATRDVRSRIAALEPDGYTRAGAAIRHATASLAAQPARHRLLLLLSDGKPNDVDHYEGRYGIEDTRQAVAEARLQGLTTFCLTVDRAAPVYMPRIFGPAGFGVLRRPERLPMALAEVVRKLLAD